MTRRELIAGTAAFLAADAAAPAPAALGEDPADYLGATGYIDTDHPRIAARAAALTAGLADDTEKALALFAFVRDGVPFGFARGFWDRKASDVLDDGRGYCVTKSTLFVALLRAAGLPARQVFVDIHAGVLAGIVDPGTAYVDHAYVDVFLSGGWRATDAYIVDRAEQPWSRLNPVLRLGFGVFAQGANRNADRLRQRAGLAKAA